MLQARRVFRIRAASIRWRANEGPGLLVAVKSLQQHPLVNAVKRNDASEKLQMLTMERLRGRE